MNRLHEGLDYLFYRIYIWGGLAAIVIYFFGCAYFIFSLELIDVSDRAMIAIFSAPVTPWVIGILAYWWWVFLIKGNKEFEKSLYEHPKSVPEISALKNWSTLNAAMIIYGGNADEALKAEKAARLPVIIWYGMSNLLVLWVLGNFWVWVFFQENESFPRNYIMRVWAPGVVVIIILMLVATPFLVSRTLRNAESAYLAPLGLSVVKSPKLESYLMSYLASGRNVIREDIVVLGGSRLGCSVYIETLGKNSYTLVHAPTPPFEIHSQAGKLIADDNAPQGVVNALKGLRKAKRWVGIKVMGGSDGIGIERKSPGENMWLYDLWLIERLLEEFNDH
jgi:hypothetical protein